MKQLFFMLTTLLMLGCSSIGADEKKQANSVDEPAPSTKELLIGEWEVNAVKIKGNDSFKPPLQYAKWGFADKGKFIETLGSGGAQVHWDYAVSGNVITVSRGKKRLNWKVTNIQNNLLIVEHHLGTFRLKKVSKKAMPVEKSNTKDYLGAAIFAKSQEFVVLAMNAQCRYMQNDWADKHEKIKKSWYQKNGRFVAVADKLLEMQDKKAAAEYGEKKANERKQERDFFIDKLGSPLVKRYGLTKMALNEQCDLYETEVSTGRYDIAKSPGDLVTFSSIIKNVPYPYKSHQFNDDCRNNVEITRKNLQGLWYVMYFGSTYIKMYLNDDGTLEIETYKDKKLRDVMVGTWSLDANHLTLLRNGQVTKTDQIEFVTCNEMVAYTHKGRRINYIRHHPFGY